MNRIVQSAGTNPLDCEEEATRMTDKHKVKNDDAEKEMSGLFTTNIWRDWSVVRQVEGNEGSTRYKPVFAQTNITTAAGGNDLMFGVSNDAILLRQSSGQSL